MQLNARSHLSRSQAGFTLIEVLVTIVIILIGLLGVLGMQVRAANVEFESYQRGQAMSLVRDMESRIAASRGLYGIFSSDTLSSTDGTKYVGVGGNIDCSGVITEVAKKELCEWGTALQGAAMKEAGGNVAAMVGARGCLVRLEPPQSGALADYYIVVVWQGIVPGAEPPDDSPAGKNGCAPNSVVQFGAGLRRGISMRVLVPNLTKET
jgi:type IV pilus assembly protein PilV